MNPVIAIVGGGISGLSAAYQLAERFRGQSQVLRIVVFEGSGRFGGVIESEKKNGFLLESGPDCFISDKKEGIEFCEKIGVSDEVIPTGEKDRRSFILKGNRLVEVPKGFYLTATANLASLALSPLLSWQGKIRMAWDLFQPPRLSRHDESVGSFVRRRFGNETLERIAQPMMGGIYTADPDHLSIRATLPQFSEMEREFGSIIRALSKRRNANLRAVDAASGPRYSLFVSMQDGMESLIRTLVEALQNVELRKSTRVTAVDSRTGKWQVTLLNGEKFQADAVLLACPAHDAADLISNTAPETAEKLRAIRYESVATLNAVFLRKDVRHPLNGFGFVVPEVEKRILVACTFCHVKFPGRSPDEDHVLLRAFAGGAFRQNSLNLNDDLLTQLILADLKEILGIQAAPELVSLKRYRNAMPQYEVGHLERVEAIERLVLGHPGLFLTGNAYRGVGIPDCIRQAGEAAEQIFNYLPERVARS